MKLPRIVPPKPKRKKPEVRLKRRRDNFTCPYCLSMLKLNNKGGLECTGNRLKIWEYEVKMFKQLDISDQQEYLRGISDKARFDEFRLQYDKDGELSCGYSNKTSDPSVTYITTIPDPIEVKRLEKYLKRSLTLEELEEGYEFTIKDKSFVLNRIRFPDDV